MSKKTKIIPKDHSYQGFVGKHRKSNENKDETSLRIENQESSYVIEEKKQIDLFNNPMIDSAKRSMTIKDQEEYKRLGEKYYSGWDFEKGGPEEMLDVAVAELSEAIKSGLHPSDLDDNEREILKIKLGKEWFKDFGFEEEDLKGIKI